MKIGDVWKRALEDSLGNLDVTWHMWEVMEGTEQGTDVMRAKLEDKRKQQLGGKVVSQEVLPAISKKSDRDLYLCIYDFSKRKEIASCVNFVTRTLNKPDSWGVIMKGN